MNDPLRHHQISIRDIARKAGVSHATVSLALRDHPRISRRRATEIKELAEAMGYRPEPMLGVLNSYRKRQAAPAPAQPGIAWLNFWAEPQALRRFREFDGYWSGVGEVAEKCGFRLEEICVGTNVEVDRLRGELQRRNVQGLVVPPLPGGGVPALDITRARAGSQMAYVTHKTPADRLLPQEPLPGRRTHACSRSVCRPRS